MPKLKALGICGSPRKGNSEELLEFFLEEISSLGCLTEKILLRELSFSGCISCRSCLFDGECKLRDDFSEKIVPKLLEADIIVLSSPVYFDNVTWLMKAFMDRTWPLRGKLRKKVGGGIVVGRGYGLDMALAEIHSWMLKHEIVICHRGVRGIAFKTGEILKDERAKKDAKRMAKAIYEVAEAIKIGKGLREISLL